MNDWRTVYLAALGAKPTPAAMDFLAKWQPYEGGHTANNARFNYLNTTKKMPGSKSINSVGVQSYGSLAQGAQAFASTLKAMPEYASLLNFLKTGQGDPSPGLSEWLSGSTKSQHGLAYAAKVTGGKVPTSAPGVPNGAMPTDVQGNDPGSSFTPLDTSHATDQIATQARANLSNIATGGDATEGVANLASLVKTLGQATSGMTQVKIPTLGQGGTQLEQSAANLVHKYLGVKYTWGGTTAAGGFDCSGLLQTVWKQLGVSIPRTSQAQWEAGTPVGKDLKAGDAVFFVGSDGTSTSPGHVGMYIGNGQYIAAPHTGAVVSVFNLADAQGYLGARRFA